MLEDKRIYFVSHDYHQSLFPDSEIMMSKSEIHSGRYHLVNSNLCNIVNLETKLTSCGIDRALPTLFISECVMVYIELESTEKLLKWIADSFPTAFFINYEQVCFF